MATPSDPLTGRILVLAFALFAMGAQAAGDVESPRTGYFKLQFTPEELLGETGVLGAEEILRSDDRLSWQLYVPEAYSADSPAGVMVYVSPQSKGGPPRRWSSVLDEKNLIWIGAINAGNRVAVGKRMFLAMLAPKVVAQFYDIDAERIYVSGFSGGG